MLPWWGWFVLWVVLLAASAAVLGWRSRQLWGSVKALGREVARASELVAELERRADVLRDLQPPAPAVTQPVPRLRAEYRRQRASATAARRARRAERTPPWARVD